MDLMELGQEGAYWMHQAQDRDHWRVLVNTQMYIGVA
jgi:hypothetical protein